MDNTEKQAFFTVLTSKEPPTLSKKFHLNAAGELEKTGGGQMVAGIAEIKAITTAEELATIISRLTPAQATAYGLPTDGTKKVLPKAGIVPSKTLKEKADRIKAGAPIVSRTREYFQWSSGPAVFMVDYDPRTGADPMSMEQVLETLYSVVPALKKAPHVALPSASTYIYHSGTCLKGAGGARILFIAADGTDIPRAGEVLFQRLWLAGHGYIAISKSGQTLVRSLVDASVWQPERLDFIAGAACKPPLEQRRPPAIVVEGWGFLDTRTALPALKPREKDKYDRLVEAAKKACEPEARAAVERFAEERAAMEPDEAKRKAVYDNFIRAAGKHTLLPSFVLHPTVGGTVTVAGILADPKKWHRAEFADPIEPDYQGDNRIAFANTMEASKPFIYSNAHGGIRYELVSELKTIRVVKGRRIEAIDEAWSVLRAGGRHFDMGGKIFSIAGARTVLREKPGAIAIDLDRTAKFETLSGKGKNAEYAPTDCPPIISEGIANEPATGRLPELVAVVTAPFLGFDEDRVIATDGYDPGTKTMLVIDDPRRWRPVPARPSNDELKHGIEALWYPMKDFPYDSPISRGVCLAGMLTAVCRGQMDTAPGYMGDAVGPSTGKSLQALTMAALAGGNPGVFADAKDEDEIRKRLLSILLAGQRTIILDNIERTFSSSVLSAFLTSGVFEERTLGRSETNRLPARCFVIITGNNLIIKGDLFRRFIQCRMDAKMERPWEREFAINPEAYVRGHRMELVSAALTILRAGIQRGPATPGRLGSFETWNDTVRKSVLLVRDLGLLDIDDPVKSIEQGFENDPDMEKLKAIVNILAERFGGRGFATNEAMEVGAVPGGMMTEADREYREVLVEVAGDKYGNPSAKILGWWFRRYAGRVVDGKKIIRWKTDGYAKVALWMVVNADGTRLPEPGTDEEARRPEPGEDGKQRVVPFRRSE